MSRILLFVLFTFSLSLELPAQRTKKYRSYKKSSKNYRTKNRRRGGRSPASIKKQAPPAKTFTDFDKSPHPHYDKFQQMSAEDQLKVMVLFMKLYGMLEGMTKYKKMYPKNKLKDEKLKTKKMKKTVKLILDLFLGADAVADDKYEELRNDRNDNHACYYAGWESAHINASGGKFSGYCTKPSLIKYRASKNQVKGDQSHFEKMFNLYDQEVRSGSGKFIKYVPTNKSDKEGDWEEGAVECEYDKKTGIDYILCNPTIYGKSESNQMLCVPAGLNGFSANSSARCHAGFLKYYDKYKLDFGIKDKIKKQPAVFEKLVSKLFLTCFCYNQSFYNRVGDITKCGDGSGDGSVEENKNCSYKQRTQYHSTCFGLMGQFHALNGLYPGECGASNDDKTVHGKLITEIKDPLAAIFGAWNNKKDYTENWSDVAQGQVKSRKYSHSKSFEKYAKRLNEVIDDSNNNYKEYYCEGKGNKPTPPTPPNPPIPPVEDGKACLCKDPANPNRDGIDYSKVEGLTADDVGCQDQGTDGTLKHDVKKCDLTMCFCNEISDAEKDKYEGCREEDRATLAESLGIQDEGEITHNIEKCKPKEDKDGKVKYCECKDKEKDFKQDTNIEDKGACLVTEKLSEYDSVIARFNALDDPGKAKYNNDIKTFADQMYGPDEELCEGNGPGEVEDGSIPTNYSIFICFKDEKKTTIYAYITAPSEKAEEIASIMKSGDEESLPSYTVDLNMTYASNGSEKKKKYEKDGGDSKKLSEFLEEKYPNEYHTEEDIKEKIKNITDPVEKTAMEEELQNENKQVLEKFEKSITMVEVNKTTVEKFVKSNSYICETKDKPHKTFTTPASAKIAKFTATLNIEGAKVNSNTIEKMPEGLTTPGIDKTPPMNEQFHGINPNGTKPGRL